ncbi:GTPase-activating protein, partial [Cladochytrium tenue]
MSHEDQVEAAVAAPTTQPTAPPEAGVTDVASSATGAADGVAADSTAGDAMVESPSPAAAAASTTATPMPLSRQLSFLTGWRRSQQGGTPGSSATAAAGATPDAPNAPADSDAAVSASPPPPSQPPVTPAAALVADDSSAAQFILARLDEQGRGGGASVSSGFGAITAQLRSGLASVGYGVVASGGKGDDEDDEANTAGGSGQLADDDDAEVDWDFWGKVTNGYEEVARRQPRLLARRLQRGIPAAIRGSVWVLMAGAKSLELEATYRGLLAKPFPGGGDEGRQVRKDLAGMFEGHEYFAQQGGSGQESLFNVLKAYALRDPDVGYCQSIAYIAAPLLLNMPDEEAFCVLDKLMHSYGFRDLFVKGASGLQLRVYQFGRLLEDLYPAIAKHLETHEVRSDLYASQWFTTIFAYRLPLDQVIRILDILFAEGIEALFRFALALLQRNQAALQSLTEGEPLVAFLRTRALDAFAAADSMDAFVRHAAAQPVSKRRLDDLAREHAAERLRTDPDRVAAAALRAENRRLTDALAGLEAAYQALNDEHMALGREQ